MLYQHRNMRILAVALGLSLIAGAIVTLAVGPVSGFRLIAHTAVAFAPMLASVLWCLRPNAQGWCVTLVRALVEPPN